jgi:hypothetical protein
MHWASITGRFNIMKWLQSVFPNLVWNHSHYFHACRNNDVVRLQWIFDQNDKTHHAGLSGELYNRFHHDPTVSQWLLDHGCPTDHGAVYVPIIKRGGGGAK